MKWKDDKGMESYFIMDVTLRINLLTNHYNQIVDILISICL